MLQYIIVMQDSLSDQKLSPTATLEEYTHDIDVPFDPAIFSFPQQLFHLLQIAASTQQEDTISWAEDGKSFTVHDPNEFEATLLVKYFQMKKYASFTRQLCAYGFSCVRKGRKPGLYYHPNFIRDNYDACSRITRGSGKAYPKKSVTYTGEMPSSNWNLGIDGNFPSTSQEEDTRKRNKTSSIRTLPVLSASASSQAAVQQLRNNLDRATTELSRGEPSSSAGSYSSRSLTPPPHADTCTSSSIIPIAQMSASALQDDYQQFPGSRNVRIQSLPAEKGSPRRQREASVPDVLFMEPRSIQDMMDAPRSIQDIMDAPDLFWNKRKRESP